MNKVLKSASFVLLALSFLATTPVFADAMRIEGTYLNTDGECVRRGGYHSFMVTALLGQASGRPSQACTEARTKYFQSNADWNVTFSMAYQSYDGPYEAESTPDGSVRCRPGYVVGYEVQHCFLTVTSESK